MERITIKQLENLVFRLNESTNNNPTPWSTNKAGKLTANIGSYYLDGAYGGWTLAQICNENGGITHPISCGFVSKREIYNLINAYMKGVQS